MNELRADLDDLVTARSRATRSRRRKVTALRLLVLIASMAGWEMFSGPRGGSWVLVDEFYISRPSVIVGVLVDWIASGVLWRNMLFTLQAAAGGFVLGASLGVAVGFVTGVSRLLSDVLTPFITALYSIPRLAIAPLFIVWFGLGLQSKIVFVATIVFFLVFFNTYSGVRDVDDELIDVLRIIRPGRLHIYRTVVLPSATAWILTGLRVSAPYALVGAVTSEIISSNRGLGYLLIRSSGQLNSAGVFASIIAMVVISLGITGLVIQLERWLLRWKVNE